MKTDPSTFERKAVDPEVLDHLRCLRAMEHARAAKRIDDHYDLLERGETPDTKHPLGRRTHDRRMS